MILCGLPPSERSRAATRSGTVHKILLKTSKDDENTSIYHLHNKISAYHWTNSGTLCPPRPHHPRQLPARTHLNGAHKLFHNYNHFSSHQDTHAESGKSDLLQHENLLRTAQEGLFRYICMEQ